MVRLEKVESPIFRASDIQVIVSVGTLRKIIYFLLYDLKKRMAYRSFLKSIRLNFYSVVVFSSDPANCLFYTYIICEII